MKLVLPRLATRIFIVSVPSLPKARDDGVAGPGDDVGGLQLADPAGGLGAGLDGGADAADVAPDHHADDAAVELDDRAGQLDARRLEHRVDRVDQADQTLRLDQAECAVHPFIVELPCLCQWSVSASRWSIAEVGQTRSASRTVAERMNAQPMNVRKTASSGRGMTWALTELADAAGGLGAGLDGGADAADVAADQRGDVTRRRCRRGRPGSRSPP